MTPTSQLRNIQLLRALAALSVVVQHALHDSDNLATAHLVEPANHAWLNFGFGVNIFFVISGFIMAYASAGEFGRPGASLRFLKRRVARIVPLYWLLTTALIAGSLVAPSLLSVPIGGLPHILASYLFIPDARLPGEIRPVLALGWTLNYEMFFYVLFALALVLPIRIGALALTAVMLALAAFGVLAEPGQTQLAYWTDPIILDFLGGLAVAWLLGTGVRVHWVVAAVAAAAGMAGFIHPSLVLGAESVVPRWLVEGVAAVLLVFAAVSVPPLRLGRLTGAGVALGDASYSLYLAHPFAVRPLRALWSRFVGADAPPFVFVLVCCLLSGIVGMAVYRLIERPLTRRMQRRARQVAPSAPLTAAEREPKALPMPSVVSSIPVGRRPRRMLISVRGIERALLFLLTASGFLAFVEPSPYEMVFGIVLVVFTCTGGLRLSAGTLPLMFCLFGFSLGGFISLVPFLTEPDPVSFTSISAYMCVTAVFFSMLLRVDGPGRLDALRKGYVLAATLASLAGILGYFHIGDILDSFTKYDRASGTFKDPNVLGTFVILPLVYLVRSMFTGRVKVTTVACAMTILFGGVFLSFSRGAWIHAAGSLVLMTLLTYFGTASGAVRRRIVTVAGASVVFLGLALPVVLSFKSVSTVFDERANFDQSYDLGEQGRFGRQITAIPMLLGRPNGFGPHRFHEYFPEDPHEVFLNAFASYGWLGGFSYLALILMTLVIGWRIALADFPLRGHAITIWSTLFVQIIQGMQIDTDHWRHFWLMLGLTWGMLPVLRAARWQGATAMSAASQRMKSFASSREAKTRVPSSVSTSTEPSARMT